MKNFLKKDFFLFCFRMKNDGQRVVIELKLIISMMRRKKNQTLMILLLMMMDDQLQKRKRNVEQYLLMRKSLTPSSFQLIFKTSNFIFPVIFKKVKTSLELISTMMNLINSMKMIMRMNPKLKMSTKRMVLKVPKKKNDQRKKTRKKH